MDIWSWIAVFLLPIFVVLVGYTIYALTSRAKRIPAEGVPEKPPEGRETPPPEAPPEIVAPAEVAPAIEMPAEVVPEAPLPTEVPPAAEEVKEEIKLEEVKLPPVEAEREEVLEVPPPPPTPPEIEIPAPLPVEERIIPQRVLVQVTVPFEAGVRYLFEIDGKEYYDGPIRAVRKALRKMIPTSWVEDPDFYSCFSAGWREFVRRVKQMHIEVIEEILEESPR
jgi:hypothetical protein